MNRDNYTPEQLKIIDSRNENLIVSAAAGSGKTTVMIERIKDLIVKDRVPISNFLVVTFTRASSKDMCEKLIKSLSEQDPDPFIIEQIDDVATADVSSLHSFCARLLKTYFYEAGLDPTFVVLAEDETETLKQKALNMLIDDLVDSGNKDYYILLDALQQNRDDASIRETIRRLDDFFNVIFDREKWFNEKTKSLYEPVLNKNRACNIINGYVSGRIKKIREEIALKIQNYIKFPKFVEYLQNIDSELMTINIDNGFVKNAERIYQIKNFGAPPKDYKEWEEIRESLDDFRNFINKELKNYRENFISNNMDTLVTELAGARKLAEALFDITNKYREIYDDLKKDKGGLDFNDLERYTIKVLENENIREALRKRYKYIFVDEYQDINEIQEKIISLISQDTNRFMVGDLKQSIYGFRLCEPEIFLNKYNQYKKDKNCNAYDLSYNFRSNANILEFVNMIFSDRMTEDFGGVNYKENGKLNAGGNVPDEEPVTLCYVDTDGLEKSVIEESEIRKVYSVKNHMQEDEVDNLKETAVAEYICTEILDLVANRKIYDAKTRQERNVGFKDIAILIPSRKGLLPSLVETLENYEIPYSTDAKINILKDDNINSVYNYLKLIYDDKDDQTLFSVLYSSIGNFTLNELAILRENNPNCKFYYQCLQNIEQNNQLNAKIVQKVQKFIQNLQFYRTITGYRNLKQIANRIVEDFNLKNIISMQADGEYKLNLLDKFINNLPNTNVYEYFSDNEQESIFCEGSTTENSVKIMTIHQSKGLEFPVAFVANVGRTFNLKGLRTSNIISKEFGIGIDYFDTINRYKNTSLAKEAVKLSEFHKTIEEEQRLLYVALTRAVNKLYVVGNRSISSIKPGFAERPTCFANWFDNFVYMSINGQSLDLDGVKIIVKDALSLIKSSQESDKQQIIFAKPNKQCIELIETAMSYRYPNSELCDKLQKTSVTEIASGYHESEEVYQKYNATIKSSSIDKGNAYHKLMQYINFESDTIQKLEENIAELVKTGKLQTEEVNFVDKSAILALLNSKEFKNIIKNAEILREKEFFMNMGDRINVQILQGVVDLAMLYPDGTAVICDYKTGNFLNSQNLSKYSKQISLYSDAIEKSFDVKVTKKAIIAIEQGKIFYI